MFESGYLPDPYWKHQPTGKKCNVWQELHRLGNSSLSSSEPHMHNHICHWYEKHFQSFAGFNGFNIYLLVVPAWQLPNYIYYLKKC
jgi:hypothetical protein